ncbi:MAG: methionine/alanine import family NSS transporter small subunit [Gulosibacter sp.]
MTPIAITMMVISLVTVWGGLVVVALNLRMRGTDRDQ